MRNGKLVAAFAALLVVSFAVMNAMPSDTPPAALLQEAVLALVALVAVRFAVPDTLKRCTQTVQRRNAVRFAMIALLLTGLVGGAITLLTWYFANSGNGAGFVSAVLSSAADLGKPAALVRDLPPYRRVRGSVHARAGYRGV